MSEIEKFRVFMRKISVDAFMLHTKDEYLNQYSDILKNLCGFIGTDAILIITNDNKCPFFTDERYIIQAQNQLDRNIFEIYNTYKESPLKWIKANLSLTASIGYYSQYFTVKEIRKYENFCKLVPYSIKKETSHRKQKIVSHIFSECSKNQCKKIAKNIDRKAEVVLLTDPNSISWLLNLRNENSKYTPCILGRAVLYKNYNVDLFIQDIMHATIEANFDSHVNIFDINELENSLRKLNSIMIDPNTTPMSIMNIIRNKIIVEKEDPCLLYKAVKNKIEINGAINAHIRDGVAVTNFLCWLENNISSKITELDAEEKLLECRKEQNLFKQLSFPTISAFNENAAIIHYCANIYTNKTIEKNGLYLIDSGGQYLDGTTDITRTVAIGDPTSKQVIHYTIVLKAHIAVASVVFPFGTTGGELDILARIHLWKFGMDYMHCTGHGVGSYLSVHEGPQAISRGNKVKFMPNMIVSNEPGYYIPREHGIRIENLMYVKKKKNGFLSFKQLTSVPYDRKLIDMQMLNQDEIKWINNYHKFVYKSLKNLIKDKRWLKKACAPLISKG
ncbi:MAG: aminopeptidase P family protein [Wolbachia endosymbiont of Meromenopon meropis]|nr:aminopeptidase P family protein [Wolbachia endosymbiont of Meromenopon meropis]